MRLLLSCILALSAFAFAAPAISINQAYLPDADVIVTSNTNGVGRDSFLYQLSQKLTTDFLAENDLDNAAIANANDKLWDNSCAVVSLRINPAKLSLDDFTPQDLEIVGVVTYNVDCRTFLNQNMAAASAALKKVMDADDKTTIAETTAEGLKGWDVVIEDDGQKLPFLLLVAEDGKSLIGGTRDTVLRQLKATPAGVPKIAATPAGSNFNFVLPISAKIRASFAENDSDGTMSSVVDVKQLSRVLFSATVQPAGIDFTLAIDCTNAQYASQMNAQISGLLPMAAMMADGNEDLAFLKKISCVLNGSEVAVKCFISNEQISKLIELGKDMGNDLDQSVEVIEEEIVPASPDAGNPAP